jgi:multisubunit Na+/H+ antiporter MnhG subunit
VGEKKNKDTKLEQIIYDGYFVKLLGTIGLFRFSTATYTRQVGPSSHGLPCLTGEISARCHTLAPKTASCVEKPKDGSSAALNIVVFVIFSAQDRIVF